MGAVLKVIFWLFKIYSRYKTTISGEFDKNWPNFASLSAEGGFKCFIDFHEFFPYNKNITLLRKACFGYTEVIDEQFSIKSTTTPNFNFQLQKNYRYQQLYFDMVLYIVLIFQAIFNFSVL